MVVHSVFSVHEACVVATKILFFFFLIKDDNKLLRCEHIIIITTSHKIMNDLSSIRVKIIFFFANIPSDSCTSQLRVQKKTHTSIYTCLTCNSWHSRYLLFIKNAISTWFERVEKKKKKKNRKKYMRKWHRQERMDTWIEKGVVWLSLEMRIDSRISQVYLLVRGPL